MIDDEHEDVNFLWDYYFIYVFHCGGAGGLVILPDEYKLTILKVGGECVYNTNPPPATKSKTDLVLLTIKRA